MDDRIQQLQELDPQIALQQPLDPHNGRDSPMQAPLPTALATKGTKRGRKAQDPQQVILRFDCSSQHALEEALRDYLEDGTHNRQHVLFEASLPVSAAFLVDYGPAASGVAKSNSYKYGPAFAPGVGPVKEGHLARSMSIMEALEHNPDDPKERMRKQRAISRSVENAIEQVDGHRYAFHNEWLARDNDAYRFSYFCNDSLLNKDRTLGGVKKNDENKVKRARKQVYDCQGYLTIKFSATKRNLEILYKHIAVHPTYNERAPLPRVGTKRFEILQKNDPNNELIIRAKEREARKHALAAKASQKPTRRKSSTKADNSVPGTPNPTKATRRQSPDDGEEVPPDSASGFRFRNLTVDTHPVAKKAKMQAATSEAASGANPPSAAKSDENAALRARLQAAEQYIKDMHDNRSPGQAQLPWPNPSQSSGYSPVSPHGYPSSPYHHPPTGYPPLPHHAQSLPHSPNQQHSPYAPPSQQQRDHVESLAAAAGAQPLSPSRYPNYPPHAYQYPPPLPPHPYYTRPPPQAPTRSGKRGGKAFQLTHYRHKSNKSPLNPTSSSPGADGTSSLNYNGNDVAAEPDIMKESTASATNGVNDEKISPELLADGGTEGAAIPVDNRSKSGSREDATAGAGAREAVDEITVIEGEPREYARAGSAGSTGGMGVDVDANGSEGEENL